MGRIIEGLNQHPTTITRLNLMCYYLIFISKLFVRVDSKYLESLPFSDSWRWAHQSDGSKFWTNAIIARIIISFAYPKYNKILNLFTILTMMELIPPHLYTL